MVLVDGYVRVSQVGGREGERFISPVVQREKIEGWARLHGALVGTVFEELDESGARGDRPLLLEAIRRVEAGASAGIVVARLDRFGRSLIDGLNAIERITDAGGTFVAVDDGFDFSTDAGRFVLRMMFSMAEWELDRVRSSWATARSRAVARGVQMGGVPTGYRRASTGRLTPDRTMAPVVSELFAMRADGASLAALARRLEAEGIRTPRGRRYWSLTTLSALLCRRTYLGEVSHGKYVNAAAHEPLVDPATWTRAQRPIPLPVAKGNHEVPLLKGLIRCAGCRRSMASCDLGSHTGYHCSKQTGVGRCPSPAAISGTVAEPYVEAIFWQELSRDRGRRASVDRLHVLAGLVEKREQELAAYRDDPRFLRTLGEELFVSGLDVRRRRLDTALLELAGTRRENSSPDVPPPDQLRQRWGSMSRTAKGAAIREALDAVFVLRGGGAAEDRLLVCRRGHAPVDLPRRGDVTDGMRALDIASVRATRLRAAARRPRSERTVRAQLARFVADREEWPTFAEFQGAGLALLWRDAADLRRMDSWARELGLGYRSPPKWTAPSWPDARIRRALRPFLASRRQWPTYEEFRAAGLGAVRVAVATHGGAERWAAEFALPITQRPHRYPDEYIERELATFLAGRTTWPPRKEFLEAGKGSLYEVVRTRGRQTWAQQFGLPKPPKRLLPRKWTEQAIENALAEQIAKRGRFPSDPELLDDGVRGLSAAIWKAGGRERWADKYGVDPYPFNRTDARIESELRTLIGKSGLWPTWSQFRDAGLHQLHRTLHSRGVVDHWIDRLGATRAPRRWTDERIEAALRDLIADTGKWPKARQFRDARLSGLYSKLQRDRTLDLWAHRLGVKRTAARRA